MASRRKLRRSSKPKPIHDRVRFKNGSGISRWELLGAMLFGGVFALCTAFRRVEVFDSRAARGIAAAFLFGTYCGIVAFGTGEKKRSLSLLSQTILGMLVGLAMASLFNPSVDGLFFAGVIGLLMGFTADWWVWHV